MRQIIWMVMLMTGSTATYGQRTEFSVQAGSGLFSYGGPGTVSETTLLQANGGELLPVLINPYGRSSGLSYNLTGQINRIAKSRFTYGTLAGYESLASRVAALLLLYPIDYGPIIKRDGYAILRNQYLNLYPFVGKRLGNERVSVDATAGLDLGFCLSSHERSELNGISGYYTATSRNRPYPAVDVRPRLNLTGYYRAFGLSLGYAQGLTKYTNSPYSDNRIYSRMWRIGVVYRLAKWV